MADPFAFHAVGRESGASHAIAAVHSDTIDMAVPCRALWIATGGDVKVTTVGGETVTFASVPNGTLLQVACKRVWATGTTAPTTILALY